MQAVGGRRLAVGLMPVGRVGTASRHRDALGRAAIAMAAVRIRACHEPGEIFDRSKLCPPTDVMAITSLPDASVRSFSIQPSTFPIDSALDSVLYAAIDSVLYSSLSHPTQ